MTKRSPRAELLRLILLELQELHGVTERAATRLSETEGQSASRYKVLTAAACGDFTVPKIAQQMGLSRQGVQKVADQLVADGLAKFTDNPHHKTSSLLVPTKKGAALEERISSRLAAENNDGAKSFSKEELEVTLASLKKLVTVLGNRES